MFDSKIDKSLYIQSPFEVAKKVLLGAYLCSNIGGRFCAGKITELEVYVGAEDKASHAYPNKKTKRNAVMFDEGGKAYVFFVYGMHNQFNVVVGEENEANAILIRSLEPIAGIEVMQERRGTDDLKNLTTGPGKLCEALGITREYNEIDLSGDLLWLSPRDSSSGVLACKRVGIDYAEEYKDVFWRYLIKDSKFISKKASLNGSVP
jgi:DNA-3-methyladenine glycosylase